MNDDELATIAKWVHDARKPLNRISMQAELVKMALNGEIPVEKATVALDKIIHSTKDCSHTLAQMMASLGANSAE
ncbi:hypothetical protein [Alteromonas sp. C1M14]|uniref:hypothetical protein n=1 Tax=Alteromonas sp. C1M14 TaxID=2841567 RepID=UPI001C0A0417|nr:hypothetical protein [Alteromonas sp. C1M14]MBU2977169.1 hypothetical protein [Alteromonas sp. C1M14]